jgi:hypothetical protein
MFVAWTPKHDEASVRRAVAEAYCLTDALVRLGLRPAGGNFGTLRKLIAHWQIPTAHWDPYLRSRGRHPRYRLEELLVTGRNVNRADLKRRLYDAGLKTKRCEMCGQGETWQGRRISLILDHINGVADDNRLENLQIVCPNCAATLDTHCGKNVRRTVESRLCAYCDDEFKPTSKRQKYCGLACSHAARVGLTPAAHKVEWPAYELLLREIAETNYSAVGRKYGVSHVAVRNWVRAYEREAARNTMTP